MTVDDIIDALGGTAKIAGDLGLTDAAVRKWRRIGVPGRHWRWVVSTSGGGVAYTDIEAANDRVAALAALAARRGAAA